MYYLDDDMYDQYGYGLNPNRDIRQIPQSRNTYISVQNNPRRIGKSMSPRVRDLFNQDSIRRLRPYVDSLGRPIQSGGGYRVPVKITRNPNAGRDFFEEARRRGITPPKKGAVVLY